MGELLGDAVVMQCGNVRCANLLGESEEELAEEEAAVVACHDHCEVPYCSRVCMEQVVAEGLTSARQFSFAGTDEGSSSAGGSPRAPAQPPLQGA